MKFECEKTLLASAIEGVSRAITNRAAIPVLEGIYLKAEGFNLTLTGYDMEMGITTTLECNVLVPGETVLDARLLFSMISRMPAGDVCIELTDEGQAKISGGVVEFEIPAMNASDYPSLPVTGADNTMTLKCGMMREMIEKTIYAVSQDAKKPAHTGELFVIEPGSLTIVALDGYRLAIISNVMSTTYIPHFLRENGISEFFEDIQMSSLCRIRKPRPEIFGRSLAALGLTKEEVVYVGDTISRDIRGARAAGWPVIQIDNPAAYHRDTAFVGQFPPDARIEKLEELVRSLGSDE